MATQVKYEGQVLGVRNGRHISAPKVLLPCLICNELWAWDLAQFTEIQYWH